jgi:integrase
MRYMGAAGKSVNLTLGSVDVSGGEPAAGEPVIGGHHTLAAARRLAAHVKHERALGRDPAAERRAARSATKFAEAAQTYIREHAQPHTRRWRETARALGVDPDSREPTRGGLADRWRGRLAGEVTADDIHAVVDEARRRGVPGLARKNMGASEARARSVASALSSMFGWLRRNRLVGSNPCLEMDRPRAPPSRRRVLTDEEIKWFWRASGDAIEPFGPLLRVMLLTGARRGEVAGMRRSELQDATWTLPPERAKNGREHRVTLPRFVLDLLPDGDPVFSTNGRTGVSGFSKVKERLDTAMLAAAPAGTVIAPWVLHDLRRTAASGLARLGVAIHVTERVLNHVSGTQSGIVAVYQRYEYEAEVAAALEAWAERVSLIVGER